MIAVKLVPHSGHDLRSRGIGTVAVWLVNKLVAGQLQFVKSTLQVISQNT